MTKPDDVDAEETVLILAPTGQDAVLVGQFLNLEGLKTEIVSNLSALCDSISGSARGVVLIAEEALVPELLPKFLKILDNQEKWSDLPIVLMTGAGEVSKANLRLLGLFASTGNFTLLERPCRTVTLLSTLQVALRARRKQYEVRSLIGDLALAVRKRDEFISVASHELKTPLTSLKLQAQMNQRSLERGDGSVLSVEKMGKFMKTTNHQLDRLTRLVEDMLDITRINTGKLAISREQVNLGTLVKEVIDRFLTQLNDAHSAVTLSLDHNILGMWDSYRLEQVVANLVSNAIRYCPGKPLHITVTQENKMAQLIVEDEGSGIDEADQERIFQRFERAVPSNNVSGLGLGLYISREIVESHHGSIKLQSKIGKGSKFTVSLPLLNVDPSKVINIDRSQVFSS